MWSAQQDEKLFQWMQDKNFQLHLAANIQYSPVLGRHVVAAAPIPAGSVIFQIPHLLVLSQHSTDISDLIADSGLTSWNGLAVAMLREFTRGAESPLHPYLSVLPSSFTMPVFWPLDPKDVRQLKGAKLQQIKGAKKVGAAASASDSSSSSSSSSNSLLGLSGALTYAELENSFHGTKIIERAKTMREVWATQYKKHVRPFLVKHASRFAPEFQTLAAYQRVIAIISSYSFTDAEGIHVGSIVKPSSSSSSSTSSSSDCGSDHSKQSKLKDEDMVDGDGSDNEDENDDDEENEVDEEAAKAVTILAPFADLLNHNSALNNARLHMQHPGAFQMVATRDIAAGEVVYNTYGEHSNSELLLKYGFVNLSNERLDDVRFELSECLVTLASSLFEDRQEDMEERLDFLDECRVMFSVSDPNPLSSSSSSSSFSSSSSSSSSSEDSTSSSSLLSLFNTPLAPPPDFEDGEFVIHADGEATPALLATLGLLLCTRQTIAQAEELIMGPDDVEDSDEDEDDEQDDKAKAETKPTEAATASSSSSASIKYSFASTSSSASSSSSSSPSSADEVAEELVCVPASDKKENDEDEKEVTAADLVEFLNKTEPAALCRAWTVLEKAVEARLLEFDCDTAESELPLIAESWKQLESVNSSLTDSAATQHFISFVSSSVRASQKRVLLSFRARIERELAAFAEKGITTKAAKKRKAAAAGKDEKGGSSKSDDKNKKAKNKK